MAIIDLPYGGNNFDSNDLKAYIQRTGRDYIIQGQTACSLSKHQKPLSLDYWLREKFARNPNTKQAVNAVIKALIETGDFEEGKFICPDSGNRCKGIRLI